MRHNNRPVWLVSKLPPHSVSLLAGDRPMLRCPDGCGRWAYVRRGVLWPHRAADVLPAVRSPNGQTTEARSADAEAWAEAQDRIPVMSVDAKDQPLDAPAEAVDAVDDALDGQVELGKLLADRLEETVDVIPLCFRRSRHLVTILSHQMS